MSQCQNKDFKSGINLKDIELKMLNNENSILTSKNTENVFKYLLQKNVESLIIKAELKPITILYTAGLIKIIREVKGIKRVNENLKAETLEKIEKISDSY